MTNRISQLHFTLETVSHELRQLSREKAHLARKALERGLTDWEVDRLTTLPQEIQEATVSLKRLGCVAEAVFSTKMNRTLTRNNLAVSYF